jgi:arginyl-tRNA synthetase
LGKANDVEGIIKAREQITEMLTEAVRAFQKAGKISAIELPEVILERPQNPEHGDYASSYPLKLARAARMNPMSLAKELVSIMGTDSGIADIEIAPPGFINFTLRNEWLTGQVNSILNAGDTFGNSDAG